MKHFNTTYTLLIAAGIAAVLGLSAPVFVYYQENALFAYVASVNQDARARSVREEGARAARKIAADTALERKQLDQVSIGKDGAASFIEWVESSGRSAQVKLDVGSIDVSGDGVLKSFSMTLHASGSFMQTRQFLMLLESAPQAVKIDSVSLDHRDKGWTIIILIHAPIQST